MEAHKMSLVDEMDNPESKSFLRSIKMLLTTATLFYQDWVDIVVGERYLDMVLGDNGDPQEAQTSQ